MHARRIRAGILLASASLVMSATPATGQRTSHPTVAVSLGTMGDHVNHSDGWYMGNTPPPWWSEQGTSYCANGQLKWGILTHPKGYEILADGTYGDRAYMMYDPANNQLRPANVNADGKLVPPTRFDRCAHEPGRAEAPKGGPPEGRGGNSGDPRREP